MGIGAHQSVYNWFNGKAMPTLDNYYTLCKILGVSMESLIVEDEGSRFEITEDEPEEQLYCFEPQGSTVCAALFWSDHLMEEMRLFGGCCSSFCLV